MPLLWSDVTPVLADRQDVLQQEAAVVFSVGCTAVRTLQNLRHMSEQLAALQPRAACGEERQQDTHTKGLIRTLKTLRNDIQPPHSGCHGYCLRVKRNVVNLSYVCLRNG